MIKSCLPAALLAAASLATLTLPADAAATVRRHLHCSTAPGLTIQFIITTTVSGIAYVTNNWSSPIPAGTTYTVTVNRHSVDYTAPQQVDPGAVFGVSHPYITTGSETCDATFIDTGFKVDTGKKFNKQIDKLPTLTFQQSN